MWSLFKRKRRSVDIYPDEVLADTQQIYPEDISGGESRINIPLSSVSVLVLAGIFLLIGVLLLSKIWFVQIVQGEDYLLKSERNRLTFQPIFAERGVIYDRLGEMLAWNGFNSDDDSFFVRRYTDTLGVAHAVGYTNPPLKDSSGFYYQDYYKGVDGVEKYFDEYLSGTNGLVFRERDALGQILSENIFEESSSGKALHLSIDSRLQEELYLIIKSLADDVGFKAGSGVLMDVKTGELITMVNYPEYDLSVMASRDSKSIDQMILELNMPFLNRAISGQYTPGSVVKPFVAIGALEENVIDPKKYLTSTKTITIPNPYNPSQPSVFRDWRVHEQVDMVRALAVSSNVYFYKIGGGFGAQEGIGINKIKEYMELFGFESETGINLNEEKSGVVPDPTWKEKIFNDVWRVGDTYNTAIGQFGFQATPLQVTRAVSALANGGYLVTPTILKQDNNTDNFVGNSIGVSSENIKVVNDGMRSAVVDGTAGGLNLHYLPVSAKTGTAQTGATKRVHSWITGFYPSDDPKYAFTILMEDGSEDNLIGGVFVMRQFLDWMHKNTPEYVLFED